MALRTEHKIQRGEVPVGTEADLMMAMVEGEDDTEERRRAMERTIARGVPADIAAEVYGFS